MITIYVTLREVTGEPRWFNPVQRGTFAEAEKYVQTIVKLHPKFNLSIRRDTFDDAGMIDIIERGLRR